VRAAREVPSGKKLSAIHVGRTGEVAGGMTQVLNAYSKWPFEAFEVSILRSRDGSSGPRAVRLFINAFFSLLGFKKNNGLVVVVHLSQGGSFIREGILLRLAHLRGFATVAHLHGSSFIDFARKHARLVKGVLDSADLILALSDETIEACAELTTTPVVYMPNAVEPGDERAKENLIVFGGAVSRRKGVDTLIEAWSSLSEETKEGWTLKIVGPVTDQALDLRRLPGLDFTGSMNHDELLHLLDRSQIAVLPSRDEALPIFLLEAMVRRNCVISTRVGGIPELLRDGTVGLLIDANDSVQLGHALTRALSSHELRSDLSARARLAVDDEYSSRVVIPRLEHAWKSVLQL